MPKIEPNAKPHFKEVIVKGKRKTYFALRYSNLSGLSSGSYSSYRSPLGNFVIVSTFYLGSDILRRRNLERLSDF